MKNKVFKEEIRKFDTAQLHGKLDQLRRDFFSLKLNAQTGHIKNHAQFSTMRKNIARIQTVLQEKEREKSK